MSNIDDKQQSQTNFSFLHQEILCQKKKFHQQTVDLVNTAFTKLQISPVFVEIIFKGPLPLEVQHVSAVRNSMG